MMIAPSILPPPSSRWVRARLGRSSPAPRPPSRENAAPGAAPSTRAISSITATPAAARRRRRANMPTAGSRSARRPGRRWSDPCMRSRNRRSASTGVAQASRALRRAPALAAAVRERWCGRRRSPPGARRSTCCRAPPAPRRAGTEAARSRRRGGGGAVPLRGRRCTTPVVRGRTSRRRRADPRPTTSSADDSPPVAARATTPRSRMRLAASTDRTRCGARRARRAARDGAASSPVVADQLCARGERLPFWVARLHADPAPAAAARRDAEGATSRPRARSAATPLDAVAARATEFDILFVWPFSEPAGPPNWSTSANGVRRSAKRRCSLSREWPPRER